MSNETLKPNAEFERFVEQEFAGNRTAAAAALDCTRIHVWRMIRGDRSVTPDMAEQIEKLTKGRFKRERLVWPNFKRKAR